MTAGPARAARIFAFSSAATMRARGPRQRRAVYSLYTRAPPPPPAQHMTSIKPQPWRGTVAKNPLAPVNSLVINAIVHLAATQAGVATNVKNIHRILYPASANDEVTREARRLAIFEHANREDSKEGGTKGIFHMRNGQIAWRQRHVDARSGGIIAVQTDTTRVSIPVRTSLASFVLPKNNARDALLLGDKVTGKDKAKWTKIALAEIASSIHTEGIIDQVDTHEDQQGKTVVVVNSVREYMNTGLDTIPATSLMKAVPLSAEDYRKSSSDQDVRNGQNPQLVPAPVDPKTHDLMYMPLFQATCRNILEVVLRADFGEKLATPVMTHHSKAHIKAAVAAAEKMWGLEEAVRVAAGKSTAPRTMDDYRSGVHNDLTTAYAETVLGFIERQTTFALVMSGKDATTVKADFINKFKETLITLAASETWNQTDAPLPEALCALIAGIRGMAQQHDSTIYARSLQTTPPGEKGLMQVLRAS